MIKRINSNNRIIISHIADIDGMGSVILAKKYFDDLIDYILCEVRDLPDLFESFDFSSYEVIYLCDLPLVPSTIEILNKRIDITSKLKHFDHHSLYNDVIPHYVNAVIKINGIRTCGTELFFNYLNKKNSKLNKAFYKKFVEATREQDTWDFQEEEFNARLLASTHALIGPEAYIDMVCSLNDNTIFKIPKLFEDLYKSDLEKQRYYINFINDNLLITNYKKYKIGVSISEQYRSIVGEKICELRPDLDFIMIINYSRNTVSLRCVKDNIDLNQIGLDFHHDGGGHKKAAGFIIDSESIPKIEKYHNMYLQNIRKRKDD